MDRSDSQSDDVLSGLAQSNGNGSSKSKHLGPDNRSAVISFPQQIELNVGGKLYTTTVTTLTRVANSRIEKMFTGQSPMQRDAAGRYFIDRDGEMFGYILNFLRTRTLSIRDDFEHTELLRQEAEYYKIGELKRLLQSRAASMRRQKCWKPLSGHISLHVRANFTAPKGRNSQVEHPFRKIQRIFVCGKVALCQEVFAKDLNETRESLPTTASRYTNRFFLRHNQLERAFDQLRENGYSLINGDGDGLCSQTTAHGDWNHFNIFVFFRG